MTDPGPPATLPPRGPIILDAHLRKVLLTIGYMLIIAGFAVAISLLWPALHALLNVLKPFIVALILSYILNPAVTFFQQKLKITRVGGVVLTYLILLALLGAFAAIVIPIVSKQIVVAYRGTQTFMVEEALPRAERMVKKLQGRPVEEPIVSDTEDDGEVRVADEGESVASAPPVLPPSTEEVIVVARVSGEELREEIKESRGTGFEANINLWLEERGIDLTVDDMVDMLMESSGVGSTVSTAFSGSTGAVAAIVSGMWAVITSVIGMIIFISFVILVTFYALIDFNSLRGVLEVLCPDRYEVRFFDMAHNMDVAVGGFIRGQIIVASIVGLMTFLGLWFLGLKSFALLIGIIGAIGNLIPYLGPVLAGAPAIAYQLFSDAHEGWGRKALFATMTLGLFLFIQFVEGFILQPKVVGKTAQLHPVAVILALAVGAMFGLVGMIVAVPLACIIRVLWKEFYWDRQESNWRRLTGKNRLDDPRSGTEILRRRRERERTPSSEEIAPAGPHIVTPEEARIRTEGAPSTTLIPSPGPPPAPVQGSKKKNRPSRNPS